MKKMLIVLLVSFSAQSFGMETIELDSDQDEVTALVGANQSCFSRFCKRASYVSSKVKRNAGIACCTLTMFCLMFTGAALSIRELRENDDTNQKPYCHGWWPDAFENGPCSAMNSPNTWAIAQCQLDELQKYNNESCVPVCRTTLRKLDGVIQSLPTGWESRVPYDDYASCADNQTDLNKFDMYLLCSSSWLSKLRDIFAGRNISSCPIEVESKEQKGLVVRTLYKDLSEAERLAVDVGAYNEHIANNAGIMDAGVCKRYADKARKLLGCRGALIS